MSPLDKLIMKTLIKKNCTDFIRHQIKFYLEFSRWALLTWGPNFLFKDLQLTAIMLRFVSTSTTLFLSHQYLISPSHSTAHGTFRVGLDSASEEEEGSPFLDLFGFVFWGGGREGGSFWNRCLSTEHLHWTFLCYDGFTPTDHELLGFLLFDLLGGKITWRRRRIIGSQSLPTNLMDRTGDFFSSFLSVFCQVFPCFLSNFQ